MTDTDLIIDAGHGEYGEAFRALVRDVELAEAGRGGTGGTDPMAALANARPELAHIRDAAWSRGRSFPAVLGCTLARVSASVPPSLTLPAITGSQGSLNLFVALVGAPGTGKSTSNRIAAELLPIMSDTIRDDLPLGSGEGLIDAYFEWIDEPSPSGKGSVKVKRQTQTGALFYCDEGATLADLGNRKGSTIMATLRAAWAGSTLGQANASAETTRRLASQSYRCALVIGFQPSTAAALLEGSDVGTPQRFEWMNAVDPSIPDDPPAWPGPLYWEPPARVLFKPPSIDVDPDLAAEIRRRDIARSRGQLLQDELDAHDDLARLKVAALLSILNGRRDINPEDWRLAGLVRSHTRITRGTIIEAVKLEVRMRETSATRRAVSTAVAIEDAKVNRATERMAKTMANKVHHANGAPIKRRDLTQAVRSTDRKEGDVAAAIDLAISLRWIKTDGDLFVPGQAVPT